MSDIARCVHLFSKKYRDWQKRVRQCEGHSCEEKQVLLAEWFSFGWRVVGVRPPPFGFRFHFWVFGFVSFSSHVLLEWVLFGWLLCISLRFEIRFHFGGFD